MRKYELVVAVWSPTDLLTYELHTLHYDEKSTKTEHIQNCLLGYYVVWMNQMLNVKFELSIQHSTPTQASASEK